ncbi:GntR family transcriptional regulator [Arthrobacter sp. CAU 1506]|uniref:GntR family transcriptional regulator n=1 Tax=Arthrobacter sp. CAU 1506 TaxID=2560052 RepID=UPI0010ACDF16|nr:GntR family transcriptional regulator [Arthrobacter sp. CAU 1506]TJY66205.1 GntR family transcriptional regulator [Arthrobacter sp. CAU 1506]
MPTLDRERVENVVAGGAPEVALDEFVYEWVRDRIIDGTLPTGSRIREREVAEELQVSRIPVREAFPRLESEGYIKSLHRRGVVVAPMELEDVVELFAVRRSLEVLAARLAAEQCAAGGSGESLVQRLDDAEAAIARGAGDEIAEATAAIHDEIVVLSGNRLLQTLMIPVRGRVQRLFHIVTERDERHLHHEHRDMCSAIVNGEVERAAALALAHVEHSRHETMPIVARKLGVGAA